MTSTCIDVICCLINEIRNSVVDRMVEKATDTLLNGRATTIEGKDTLGAC
jgi:hypothetical protein